MTCSFCQEEGKQFTAITQDGEVKNICRKCIKFGHAVPKQKPRPHLAPCFTQEGE